MGAAPLKGQPVAGGGYAENTADWRVELEDGRSVFAKQALDDLAAGWLRAEHRVYAAVSASFMPELVAWRDGGRLPPHRQDLPRGAWLSAMTALVVAAALAATPSFVFGRAGGNVVPLRATIDPSGRVVVNGQPGRHPDIATLYVKVGRARLVTEHGACNRRFNRVYVALAKAVGEP